MIGPRIGIRAGGRVGLAIGIGEDQIASASGYPLTAAQMRAATGGYGMWSAGWLCDEASGNLVPSFGSPTLTAGGTPIYGIPGPRGGTDKAVGFDSLDDQFVGGTGDFNVGATDDLCVAWIGKFTGTPVGTDFLVVKGLGTDVGRWQIFMNSTPSLMFQMLSTSGGPSANFNFTPFTGEWHVAIACADRSTGKFRLGVKGLSSGTAIVSTEGTLLAESSANASAFYFGNRNAANPALNWQCAALYMGAGAGVATGMSANLSAALSSFAMAVAS